MAFYRFIITGSVRSFDSRKYDIFLRIAASTMSILDSVSFKRYCVSLFFNRTNVKVDTYTPYVVAMVGTKICKLNFQNFSHKIMYIVEKSFIQFVLLKNTILNWFSMKQPPMKTIQVQLSGEIISSSTNIQYSRFGWHDIVLKAQYDRPTVALNLKFVVKLIPKKISSVKYDYK